MAANGDQPATPEGTMFLAELGLDGRRRPVPGALAAPDAKITTIVVATANQADADLEPDLTVIAADSLTEVAAWLAAIRPRLPRLPLSNSRRTPFRLVLARAGVGVARKH
jgi:predicted ATPase with chaperone activity